MKKSKKARVHITTRLLDWGGVVLSRVIEVGLKLDAPVQCDCCRQRFMDQKSLALHKKFIYDPNRADAKLEE